MSPIVTTTPKDLSEKMLAFTKLFGEVPHIRAYGEVWPLNPVDEYCLAHPDGFEVVKISNDNHSATIMAHGKLVDIELLLYTELGLCLADGRYLAKP